MNALEYIEEMDKYYAPRPVAPIISAEMLKDVLADYRTGHEDEEDVGTDDGWAFIRKSATPQQTIKGKIVGWHLIYIYQDDYLLTREQNIKIDLYPLFGRLGCEQYAKDEYPELLLETAVIEMMDIYRDRDIFNDE